MADRAYGQTHKRLDRRDVYMYTSLIEKLEQRLGSESYYFRHRMQLGEITDEQY